MQQPLRATENHQGNKQQYDQDRSDGTDPDGSHPQRRYPHQQERARSLGELADRLKVVEDVPPSNRSTASDSGRPRALRPQRLSTKGTAELAPSTRTSPSEADDCTIEDDDDDCSSEDRGSGGGEGCSVIDGSACCLLSAGLSLDRRVFVVGDRVIADVEVSNRANMPAVCVVSFQQVG